LAFGTRSMYALPDIPFDRRAKGRPSLDQVLKSVGIEQSIRISILTSWCTVSDFPLQRSVTQLDVGVAIADAIIPVEARSLPREIGLACCSSNS
jgi:hypothetical protein